MHDAHASLDRNFTMLLFVIVVYTMTPALSASAQLLLAPPFEALSSSIFATLFLNSTYWHFSYDCLSSCSNYSQPGRSFSERDTAYDAFPRHVIFFESTPVERDEEVGAAVAVG